MNNNLSISESISNLFFTIFLHLFFFSLSFYLINNLSYIFAIPLFVIISLIHQKFLGELLHEGNHYNLFKFKIINELLSNYLIGLFFFVTVKNYRKKHFQHHAHDIFFKESDPETGPIKVKTKKEFWKNIFFDLIGVNGAKFLLRYTNHEEKNKKFKTDLNFFAMLIIQSVIFFSIIKTQYLIYYLIYYFSLGTLYHLQLRLRIIGQHIFLDKNNSIQYEKTTSRTILGGILEKIFFTSDLTAYHDLHHANPMQPYRKLKKFFMENNMSQTSNENIFTRSRFRLLSNYYKSLN